MGSKKLVTVALGIIVFDGKILLQKRKRGDYIGYYGLCGGKVEANEHVAEAAVREVLEETGLKGSFVSYLGLVSELILNKNDAEDITHCVLHLCEIAVQSSEFVAAEDEGELEWFDLEDLEQIKEKAIPSDYLMIQKMFLEKEKKYYECVLEKDEERYSLVK